jgi:hypothetical protein
MAGNREYLEEGHIPLPMDRGHAVDDDAIPMD